MRRMRSTPSEGSQQPASLKQTSRQVALFDLVELLMVLGVVVFAASLLWQAS